MRILTDPDEARRAFEPWRKRHARPAWRPITQPGEGLVAGSRFGGRPALLPDEPWPTCGHCRRPQTLLLQLDLDALPPDAGDFGGGLLQFFYCTTCDDGSVATWEPFSDAHLFRILRERASLQIAESGREFGVLPASQIAGWERFDDLPGWDDAKSLELNYDIGGRRTEPSRVVWDAGEVAYERLDYKFTDVTGEPATREKLGGWPFWVQAPEWVACPTCGTRMRLVMQIDSFGVLDYGFGDAGCGHVMQCPNHPDVLSFAWACC